MSTPAPNSPSPTPAAPIAPVIEKQAQVPQQSAENIAQSKKPTFTWNQTIIDVKLEAVRANLSQYDGKPGYNPHMYLHKVVKPLVERMEGGETSESLYNAILSLDEKHNAEAPGNTAKENRELGCIEPQSSGKSHALGQHMGASYLSKS